MKFGRLELDPAENPAVLDTATWDAAAAWRSIASSTCDWGSVRRGARGEGDLPPAQPIALHAPSAAASPEAGFILASLPDGQDVMLRIGIGTANELGSPLGLKQLASGETLAAYPADAAVMDWFCRGFKREKAPRPLGGTPRLGVGTRMTNSVWPGIFSAMANGAFATNGIQNSVRELNLLDALWEGAPPERNFSTGIGMIECGWTGSTYEGLWLAGVLAALKWNGALCYGADADHVQVKRGADGLERAKRVLRAARYCSFYTLDMADVLDYAALEVTSRSAATEFLRQKLPSQVERSGVLECHQRPFQLGSEVKGAVVFLASEASSFATGTILTIDGGYTIW